MGLKTVRLPDAAYRTGADARRNRHHVGSPVRRFARRVGKHQRHHPLADLRPERRNARRPRLVAQQPVAAFRGKALLPEPHAGLDLLVRPMISSVPTPSADKSTIWERQTCFRGALRFLISAVRRARSLGEMVKEILVRMPRTRLRMPESESPSGLMSGWKLVALASRLAPDPKEHGCAERMTTSV